MRGTGGVRGAALRIAVGALAVIALVDPLSGSENAAPKGDACRQAGTWLDPESERVLAPEELFTRLAERRVVLLGEEHSNAAHHRWQLHTLAALHSRKSSMVLGFEMFPRRVQPALDGWVRGDLDVESFLEASDWKKVWGFDPELYLPLFHFARQNRIPMVALNVERSLVARVGREGWAAVPEGARAGISDPKPASAAYLDSLARVYAEKQRLGLGGQDKAPTESDGPAPDRFAIKESEAFSHFVEAQLTWDRAMAEALAAAARRAPDALIVAIVGRGHVEHGYGVPSQLADLEFGDSAVLLPVSTAALCSPTADYLADAAFVVEPPERIAPHRPKPRLGVMIEMAGDELRVMQVLEGSVAEAANFRVGDRVLLAAGFPIARAADLIEIVQRQAPGTWLPLSIRRGSEDLDVLAKFPSHFPDGE